jgi:hypothetical protein
LRGFRRDFSVKRFLAVNSSHSRNSAVANISRCGSTFFNTRTRCALAGLFQVGLGSGTRRIMRTGSILRTQDCALNNLCRRWCFNSCLCHGESGPDLAWWVLFLSRNRNCALSWSRALCWSNREGCFFRTALFGSFTSTG